MSVGESAEDGPRRPAPVFDDLEYDFDEAWYDLGRTGTLLGDDENFRAAYARVLVRLPEEIRRFTLDRITFLSIGRTASGWCWPMSAIDKRSRKWLIVIDENYSGDMESNIAHEIAHARLGHNALAGGTPAAAASVEGEADDLSVAWGFTRCYPPGGSNTGPCS